MSIKSGVVPQEGLEPPHPREYQILSLARLPVPPLGPLFCSTPSGAGSQDIAAKPALSLAAWLPSSIATKRLKPILFRLRGVTNGQAHCSSVCEPICRTEACFLGVVDLATVRELASF